MDSINNTNVTPEEEVIQEAVTEAAEVAETVEVETAEDELQFIVIDDSLDEVDDQPVEYNAVTEVKAPENAIVPKTGRNGKRLHEGARPSQLASAEDDGHRTDDVLLGDKARDDC